MFGSNRAPIGLPPNGSFDSGEKRLHRKRGRTTRHTIGGEIVGTVGSRLSGKNSIFKIDDLLQFGGIGRLAALSMNDGRIDRLTIEARLASIPHQGAIEFEIGSRGVDAGRPIPFQ